MGERYRRDFHTSCEQMMHLVQPSYGHNITTVALDILKFRGIAALKRPYYNFLTSQYFPVPLFCWFDSAAEILKRYGFWDVGVQAL